MSCFRTWKKNESKVESRKLSHGWNVDQLLMNLFCRKIEAKRICMTLQHSSLDNGAQRNTLFYLRAIPRYWKNMNLCYTCIYILAWFTPMCVWANRKKLTSIVNESADQHSKCSKVRLASKYFQTTWFNDESLFHVDQ